MPCTKQNLGLTRQACLAVTTELVEPAHSHTVTNSEVGNIVNGRPDLGDDTNTFMPEPHVGVAVVLIGTADAAVGDLDDDLPGRWVAVALALDDVSSRGAFEYGEVDAHVRGCSTGFLNGRKYLEKGLGSLYGIVKDGGC